MEGNVLPLALLSQPVRCVYYSVTASQPSVSPIQGGPPSCWKALTFSQQHNQATPTATHPRSPIGRCTHRLAGHVLLTPVYKQAHSEKRTDQRMQWRKRVTPRYFRFGFNSDSECHYDTNLYIYYITYIFGCSCLCFFVKHKANNTSKWTDIAY